MVKFGANLRPYFSNRASASELDKFSSAGGLENEYMPQFTGFLMVAYDV